MINQIDSLSSNHAEQREADLDTAISAHCEERNGNPPVQYGAGEGDCTPPEIDDLPAESELSEELPMPDDAERHLGAVFRKVETISCTTAYWTKQVFLPSLAAKSLSANETLDVLTGTNNLAEGSRAKEHAQLCHWRNIVMDVANGTRKMVVGSAGQIKAMEAIAHIAPNFVELCALFTRALKASAITNTPFCMPPILLLGPPGVGKSYVAAAIARAIGTKFVSLSMPTATAVNPLTGTAMVWKNPKIGIVAKALLDGETASPVILLDEIDKAFHLRGDADPLAPLHALLETDTARCFEDEFLELQVAADSIIWISTANSVANIAPSILDRHLILEVTAPTADHMRAVITSIYRDAVAPYGNWFNQVLSTKVTDKLTSVHPRRVKRLLLLACSHAASLGRREMNETDVDAALNLAGRVKSASRIGFLA